MAFDVFSPLALVLPPSATLCSFSTDKQVLLSISEEEQELAAIILELSSPLIYDVLAVTQARSAPEARSRGKTLAARRRMKNY